MSISTKAAVESCAQNLPIQDIKRAIEARKSTHDALIAEQMMLRAKYKESKKISRWLKGRSKAHDDAITIVEM